MPPQPDLNALLAASIAQNKAVADAITAHLEVRAIERRRKQITSLDSGGPVADYMPFNRPALLKSLSVYNGSAGTIYVQLFDAPGPRTDGAIPNKGIVIPLGPNAAFISDWGSAEESGIECSQGIYLCASTTDLTKTLLTTKTVMFSVGFRPE